MTPEAPSADDAANTFVFAFHYKPGEGWRELAPDASDCPIPTSPGEVLWVHMNEASKSGAAWLMEKSGLDEYAAEAMLEEDTRPRAASFDDGFLLNLRGVNMNPGSDPEDMLTLRTWFSPRLLITMRGLPVMAARDLAEICRGKGEEALVTTGEMISYLAEKLADRIAPVVDDFEEQLADFEDALLNEEKISRRELSALRRAALQIRRYIAPQRDAVIEFMRIAGDHLTEDDRIRLREANDVILRVIETLDMARDRAQILQEQLVEERAEAMNQRLFVLSIISAIFLPLSFVTGLFGVNVGGMPGVNSHLAFALLAGAMLLIGLVLLVIFRRLKWL